MRGGEMTSLRIATMEGGGESRTDEGDNQARLAHFTTRLTSAWKELFKQLFSLEYTFL